MALRERVPAEFSAAQTCVFFAQHSPEKRLWTLWEGRFFIAWRGCSVNVTKRRRGASPCCAARVTDCTGGAKSSRLAGSKGKFQQVLSHWADTEPSQETMFGGSR